MTLNKLGTTLIFAIAMVGVSMLGATAAQAEENKGPLWIVGTTPHGLVAGETRAIVSRTEAAPVLRGSIASLECEKATNTGFLLGGSPGTDYAKIIFEKCNLEGAKNCVATGLAPIAATNAGEIRVDALTALAFAKGSRTSAVDIFAAESESNLFSEFEFLNKSGATTELCNLLNKTKIKVTAAGTELKIKGFARKAGQIAEVGFLKGGSFFLSLSGETSEVELLRLGNGGVAVSEAELFNTATAKYEVIKAELSAGALGDVVEEASAEVETSPKEPFGYNGPSPSEKGKEESKGPLWIVGSPAKGLVAGETRAIVSETEAAPVLKGTAASVECEKATNTGFLLGGSPGTDYAKIIFEKCNLVGAKNCIATGLKPIAATNSGEIRVDVLTVLAFAKGSRTSATDIFSPEGEAANENLFSEFEFLNKSGASTELCNLLNKTKIKVTAAGTELKIKGFARKAGQIAEVGFLKGGSFFLSLSGETSEVELLRLGNGGVAVSEAELFNTATAKYEVIKAELSAGALGDVVEEASAEVETSPKEPFGYNSSPPSEKGKVEGKGPLWIVGSPAKGLLSGETRGLRSESEDGPLILHGTAASVECEKATNEGFLLGGSPGTGYAKIIFEKCNLVGDKNCIATGLKPVAATNSGEIIVSVLTILAFAKGSSTSAVDIFAPTGEAASENLFSEFELVNKPEATEELCGLLNKTKIKVSATGTELKVKSEARKAGQIAEVGHAVGGSFVLSTPGLTSEVGLLRLGNGGIAVSEAELLNSTTEKYEVIKAELSAGALGSVIEEATAEVTVNKSGTIEPFGWDT